MNTNCAACHQPVNVHAAVVRAAGDLVGQVHYHPACFTVVRATHDICTRVADAAHPVGGTLSERLERVGYVQS